MGGFIGEAPRGSHLEPNPCPVTVHADALRAAALTVTATVTVTTHREPWLLHRWGISVGVSDSPHGTSFTPPYMPRRDKTHQVPSC